MKEVISSLDAAQRRDAERFAHRMENDVQPNRNLPEG
jgi:hypothetical protein